MDIPDHVNIEELKKMLKRVVWDYNISEDELLEIFLHDKKGHSIEQAGLEAKLLAYYSWHRIIQMLGYPKAFEMLKDEVIVRIFPKSYQAHLYELRNILSRPTLPASG